MVQLMNKRPKYVVIVSVLALIGALFATVATILSAIDINSDGLITSLLFSLLTLSLFMAVAGSLNADGQWSWKFLIFAEVLCAAVPITAYMYGVMEIVFCAALVILASVMIVLTTTDEIKDWVDTDRI